MKWTQNHETQMTLANPQSLHPPAIDNRSGLRSQSAEHRVRRAILKKLAWRLNRDKVLLESTKAIGQELAWGG